MSAVQRDESLQRDVRGSALASWLFDPASGRILEANDAAARLYRLPAGQRSGATIQQLVPSPSDQQTLREDTGASFVDGGVHRRSDGSSMRVEVNVQQVLHEGREALLVTAVDVTTRSEAQDRLIRSERQLADAQQLAHVGSFEWEIASNTIRWSDELYRIYGLRPQEFEATYEAFLARIHPDDRARIDATVRNALTSGEPFEMEERVVRPDGTIRILESRGHLVDEPRRIVGVCRDVTDLRAAERQRDLLARGEREARRKAEEAHAQVSEILERITDAFVALDENWNYIYVNEKAAQIFGHTRESLIGKHIWTEFPEGVGQPFHLAYEHAMATQQAVQLVEYYPPYDKWFENRIHPSPNGLAIYFQDITERRRKEDELREVSDRLARTEAFSLVMVCMVTLDGYFSKVPPTLCRLLGYEESELLATHVERLIHPDDIEEDRQHRARIVRGDAKSLDIELRLVAKNGAIVWVYLNCSAVYDPTGTQTHFIVYMRDITERHRAEERIRHQALHDDMTGLPNRVLFNDRLTQAIAHARRTGAGLAVVTLDLDDFKHVNDNFGHSCGDAVIGEVASRLTATLRGPDNVYRLGGDEFAILAEDIADDSDARAIADQARSVFADSFDVAGCSVRLTCSAGVSIFPRDGQDAATLFRNAESALNGAKEGGHDTLRMFEQAMSGRFRNRLLRELELHQAVERCQLVSFYQPILRTADRRIVAVEALSRWNHPERGLLGPDEFIPLAEETRLIVPIGEFMLRTACRDVKRWIDEGHDLRLSVNLSVRQFQEMNLLHTIDAILAETGFEPSRLEFEVTETVAMQNAELTMSLLRELRQRNIGVAIDDFGVGQTSLIYLRQFPINTIKIDKVFINDILKDGTDAAIVSTIIDLAHTLGLCATAEGVESEEQVAMLERFGCDRLQGFHFSRPLPADGITQLLRG